jgi:DNA-binding SARP family transcriptional activator
VKGRDEGSSPGVVVCLLGRFEILKHGSPISLRPGGKVQRLVGALAMHPHDGMARETLIDDVWPVTDPVRAGRSLNSLAHWLKQELRDALGGEPPIVRTGARYALNLAVGLGIDVLAFDAAVEAGQRFAAAGETVAAIRAFDHARDLYAGDLTDGADILFLLERERLRARYLSIVAQLAEHSFATGDYPLAFDNASRLLEADPCREDAHRMLMRVYVRTGARAQALRHYEVCRQILAREFDAQPESATYQLFDLIRRHPDDI